MWIWMLLMAAASAGQAAMAEDFDSCDNTKMINCIVAMSHSHEKENLFFPDTQDKLKQYCSHLREGLDCAAGLIDRCASESEKKLYQNLTTDMVGINAELCTDGSPLSTRYLAHVNCYKKLSEMFKVCTDRFIGNIVAVHTKPHEDQDLMTCCTVHEYSQCMRNVITDSCEKDAADLVEEIVEKMLSKSVNYCSYKSDVPTTNCRKNLEATHSLSSTTYEGEESNGTNHPSNSTSLAFLLLFIVSYFS